MAQSLRLETDPDLLDSATFRLSWFEKEWRRRIWWLIFVTDRYNGAGKTALVHYWVLKVTSHQLPPSFLHSSRQSLIAPC